jgi:hypothetical protein
MKDWKKWLVPMLCALASMAFLVPAVVGPVIKGEPLNNVFLVFALMFLTFSFFFFAIARKSGGGSGPPSA